MHCPRNQLFTSPGLAQNEYGRAGGGDRLDGLQRFPDRRALADDLFKVVLGPDLFLEVDVFLLELQFERGDLFVSQHIFDSQGNLTGDSQEE